MFKSYIAQELKKAEAKVGRNRAIYWIKGEHGKIKGEINISQLIISFIVGILN